MPTPTGQTSVPDRSDRAEQPVRPIDPELEQKAEEVAPTSVTGASDVMSPAQVGLDENPDTPIQIP